jgi:hypothetical protein
MFVLSRQASCRQQWKPCLNIGLENRVTRPASFTVQLLVEKTAEIKYNAGRIISLSSVFSFFVPLSFPLSTPFLYFVPNFSIKNSELNYFLIFQMAEF